MTDAAVKKRQARAKRGARCGRRVTLDIYSCEDCLYCCGRPLAHEDQDALPVDYCHHPKLPEPRCKWNVDITHGTIPKWCPWPIAPSEPNEAEANKENDHAR